MATSIGANCDRHWRPFAPFKWRHLIHSMAILSSQSPFRVSGSFGDPMAPIDTVAPLTTMATMATMAIHLRQWCNGDNGANSDDGDPLVPMATMAPMAPMTSWRQWCDNGAKFNHEGCFGDNGATHRIAIGDNGASIGAIYCRHWRQWRQMIHSPNLMTLLPKFQ